MDNTGFYLLPLFYNSKNDLKIASREYGSVEATYIYTYNSVGNPETVIVDYGEAFWTGIYSYY